MKRKYATLMALIAASALGYAQADDVKTTPVNADNFNRAETDMYFASAIKLAGGIGKLDHRRELMSIDKQTVVRPNRDTLYSAGVFDLDAGPVTITLPDAGKRFMSLVFINEDHYVQAVHYGAGKYTLSKSQAGSRYVLAGIRLFVDPTDPKDIQQVHALQDEISVTQAGTGKFEAPTWDAASQKRVRDALLVLAGTLPDAKRMYGQKGQVDPVRHLIGTASGWGGNPEKDATYVTVTPPKNDGHTVYRLTVKDVPVDGFWSISVYNAQGYMDANPYDAYSLNNITAKKAADGSVTVQFGGCDGKIPNCLPVPPGWNYWVRLYRPRAEVLSGMWTFPEAQEMTL